MVLERSRRGEGRLVGELGIALSIHVIVALVLAARPSQAAVPPPTPPMVVDIDPEPPPPPPPPLLPREETQPSTNAVPAPRAQAAAVVTKAARSNEPLDFSSSFVSGSAADYAGGTTAADGTSSRAVHVVSSPPASSLAPAHAPIPDTDHSSRPRMSGGGSWNCPFPPEADTARIDTSVVAIRVDVDASGAPKAVAVIADPGHGFGREARRCALSKHWSPARDRNGTSTEGTVTVNVHFDR